MDQITLFDYLYPSFKIDKPIRLVELFAGYGSQAMALERLGADFEHYRVVEFDDFAVKSYNLCHNTNFAKTDIQDVKGDDLGIVDTDKYVYIMTYSFPCTDLSLAGGQQGMAEGSGTRSSLLWEVKRLLNETSVLPQVLLMENVPQVHSDDNMPHFQKWLDFLEEKGYSTYIKDLNAYDYGVGQNRERCFVVSILGKYSYRFPTPMDLRYVIENYQEELTEEMALKYIVKNEKARALMVELDEKGELH